jgi:arsenate reductase
MAEGFLQVAVGDTADVFSAGSIPSGYVHPLSIKVMAEAGVDITDHTSKHMNEFLSRQIDVVITVCGNADQVCPHYPGQVARYHWGFDDPAHAQGTEEEILNEFRRVRDEIKVKFTAYGTEVRAGRLNSN